MISDLHNIYLFECIFFILLINIISFIIEIKDKKTRKRYHDNFSIFTPLKSKLFSIYIIIVMVIGYFVLSSSNLSLEEDDDISKK